MSLTRARPGNPLSAIAHQADGAPKVLRVPSSVFLGLAAIVELLGKVLGRAVPLTRYRARSLRPLANFRLDTARRELGWEPRVGVEDGLARTFSQKLPR